MANFALVGAKQALAETTMHTGGKKRIHLVAAGGDKSALSIQSSNSAVVTAQLVALFDGPKGIWTVGLSAAGQGKAEIVAKRGSENIANLKVEVVALLSLPDPTTTAGLFVRLFLAEARNPGQSGFSKTDSKTAMQRMKLVVENRLGKKPAQFGAPGATTVFDIVKAPGQFNGFQQYPTLADGQRQTIDEVLRIANDDSDSRQGQFIAFVQEAGAVAAAATIADPSPKSLVAWRTAGSGSPGPNFVPFGTPLSGNQFYSLK